VRRNLSQMAQELKLLILLLTILCSQFSYSHSVSLNVKRTPRATPRRSPVASVLNDESSSEDLRAILAYIADHDEEEGRDTSDSESQDFSSSHYNSRQKPIKYSSAADQLQMEDDKASPTLKRFSEFLGGKRKRFSEFLGGKRKRFSEFLGGKKRYSDLVGGKKRISSTEEVMNNKRFSEFLGGKRSSVILDPAESMELGPDTSSLYEQQVLEY